MYHGGSFCATFPEKPDCDCNRVFQLNPSFGRVKSPAGMKSLRDEILLRRDKWTDLISSEPKAKISSEHRSDFTARSAISFDRITEGEAH